MSQEKLESINRLNQLQGKEYYDFFQQITWRIYYSKKEQLLEYEEIIDKARQTNQNDSKSCPRTRQQTCKILKEIICMRKKTLTSIECYELWKNRNVPKKQQYVKPQTSKSSSIFSPIWSLFRFGKKETSSQYKNQQKSSQKQSYEKQQIDSKQDEEMKGLLTKVVQSQENFDKQSSKKEGNTQANKTKLIFDNKAKSN